MGKAGIRQETRTMLSVSCECGPSVMKSSNIDRKLVIRQSLLTHPTGKTIIRSQPGTKEVAMNRYFKVVVLSVLFIVSSSAQEGMWLLSQLDKLDLKKKGLQIEVSDIYSREKPALYNAVLQLGGGTASFVSPEGLILTNHHVAYTALQRASTENSNYLTNGFLAKSRSEEIKAPGYRARMLLEMKDVTPDVLAAGEGIADPMERAKKITQKIAEVTGALEEGKDDIEATVADMYNGKQYVLYVYKVFKDIRIVYSPPLSIGKYGGEIDNWMWPRHTGDFSFLRVYVSPDGKGKEYAPANVPYVPKVWLKAPKTNLKEGDLTFVIGFPGYTTRYRDVNSVSWNYNVNYPFAIRNFTEIIALLDDKTKGDPAGALKVASLKNGLANTLKNFEGKVAGMKKTNFVQKKIDFEKEFMDWVDSQPARKEKYGDIFERTTQLYSVLAKTKDRDNVFGNFQGLAGTPLSVAWQLYTMKKEIEKPVSERQPGFSGRDVQEAADALQYTYSNYYEPVDKALMVRALRMINELPSDQRVHELEYVFSDKSKTIERFVDEAFRTSKLNDPAYARTLFSKSSSDLQALNDAFITMIARVYPFAEEVRKANQDFAANVGDLRKRYIDALYEWKGSGLYPDANSTMRFTSGPVKGYRPADAVWYYPFTTLRGVVEKNTGIEPFDAPGGLIDLYTKRDFGKWMDPSLNDVPVAFTHQIDITGGNSGSPVMNAKGELVGVVFDGNYEAMISDWQYDPDLQRGISVDIQYVLFVTDKFAKAGFILDEMGVAH